MHPLSVRISVISLVPCSSAAAAASADSVPGFAAAAMPSAKGLKKT